MKKIFILFLLVGTAVLVCSLLFTSCGDTITTYGGDKYFEHVPEFQYTYFSKGVDEIKPNELALYVDYSTCNVLGQNSPFYQALVPSWVNAAKKYYSIKGNEISEEDIDDPEDGEDVYTLLRSIEEVNYADLVSAITQMSKSNTESVLLTDGEYYKQSIARGNINNPYMANALKTWITRGHDIFFFSEPYEEPYNGQIFHKKRFYIIFTDVRLENNIFDRIMQTTTLQQFPEVEIFHLSADHPALSAEGFNTKPNDNLSAKVQGFGSFEAQEWEIAWKNGIEPLVVNAVNPESGEALPNGECVTGGLKIDRNSFGGYRIKSVKANVYNINQEFSDFANNKEQNIKVGGKLGPLSPATNFIVLDDKEFNKHGIVNLYFDTPMYTPGFVLNGSPYNYFKIDICISEVEDIFARQFAHQFEFESIDMPGQTNTSVAESIKQCLADPGIKAMISSCPIYTIYVKSLER